MVEQYGLPVIMTAEAAYPIGIQNKFAILLEPVSNAELISTAERSYLGNARLTVWRLDQRRTYCSEVR